MRSLASQARADPLPPQHPHRPPPASPCPSNAKSNLRKGRLWLISDYILNEGYCWLVAFIGTLISCYCNPDVGNRRGGGRGGPKSREKGEKNNGEHVLLLKITCLRGLFGPLKTWFGMRLIGWCHFRSLTSDISTLLRSSFCKCCISHIDFSVEYSRIGLG